MQNMQGNLDFISILDLIQWADNSNRSGTLTLSNNELQNKFYFQEGKIVLVNSGNNNDHFEHFLVIESELSPQEIQEKKCVAETLGLPLISYLISEKIISKEILNRIIRQIALSAVVDVLNWLSGEFEFNNEIPASVLHGPIRMDSAELLMESTNIFNESRMNSSLGIDKITDELKSDIMEGNIDLPAIPDIIQQIQQKIEDPNASIEKIIECINDQILVAKILKICNSPYYKTTSHISTLKEAVVLIGLKSLLSIVAVHALSSFSPNNSNEVKKVLGHSLVSAMIARQIARDMSTDFELAFICGLMHDIGKTIMLDLLYKYMLPPKLQAKVIDDNHTEIGYLLAKKWNFGEDIQECIRYHHSPDKAITNRGMVELVFLANSMAHTWDQPGTSGEIYLSMAQCNKHSESNSRHREIQYDSLNMHLEQVKYMYKEALDFLG